MNSGQVTLPITEDDIGEGNAVQPVVLILDTSYSMSKPDGDPAISHLNNALPHFSDYLRSDPEAYDCVRIKIITAGGTVQQGDFLRLEDFTPQEYVANGGTPLAEAFLLAINEIEEFRDLERKKGKKSIAPLILTISDGAPTDSKDLIEQAHRRAKRIATENGWQVIAIATPGADENALAHFSPSIEGVLSISSNLDFDDVISFASEIVQEVYRSDGAGEKADYTDAVENYDTIDLKKPPSGVSIDTGGI